MRLVEHIKRTPSEECVTEHYFTAGDILCLGLARGGMEGGKTSVEHYIT